MKSTGYKLLEKASAYNFLKWGEYMKRAQLAERKVKLLKELLLLTHDSVSNVEIAELQVIQWREFIKEFPEEL